MHVRLINEADAVQIVDLMYEIHGRAVYVRGHSKLNPDRVGDVIVWSLRNPHSAPCFVNEAQDGRLTGMLYGTVENTLFGDEKWFHERVFYIREEYRSYRRMRAYMDALQEWAGQEGITRLEFGNAFQPDPRLSLLYKHMGFNIVNTVYARRV